MSPRLELQGRLRIVRDEIERLRVMIAERFVQSFETGQCDAYLQTAFDDVYAVQSIIGEAMLERDVLSPEQIAEVTR